MTSKTIERISLRDCIAPIFYEPHHNLKEHKYVHNWFDGGRGSTKSSFAAIESVLTIKRVPDANVIYLRKVQNTLRDSCFADVIWAYSKLGLAHEFKPNYSRLEIVHKPSGRKIYFRGSDKPEKLKSMKATNGYFALIIFEEADYFDGPEEIRSLLQTFMRGGNAQVLYMFNPPRSKDHWCNIAIASPGAKAFVHHSCYTDIPREWLGEQFFDEAEELKATNELAYRHEYKGEATGTGGTVFDNVTVRVITDAERSRFNRTYQGVDWGWFPDPWVFLRVNYDHAHRTLYLFNEDSGQKLTNAETAQRIIERLTYTNRFNEPQYDRNRVICDSSEKKSIQDYKHLNIRAVPAYKPPNSVNTGIKWLQSLRSIVIDPVTCPLAAREFVQCEYERLRDGRYTSAIPDIDNHTIDATRYACEPLIYRSATRT